MWSIPWWAAPILFPAWCLWAIVWLIGAVVLGFFAVLEWLFKPSTRYGRGGW